MRRLVRRCERGHPCHHVRRKHFELHVNESSKLATQAVQAMAALWQIEDEIRGQSPEHRRAIRQQRSRAIVHDLFAFWERELPRLSAKSKLAEAIRYGLARRRALERFLDDGRVEIGRVDDWRSDDRFRGVAVDRRLSPCVGASFRTVAPFPVAARQTGHADFPHPAFSCSIKPSRSSGWYAAGVAGRA